MTVGIFLMILGAGLIYLSARQSSQYLRKMGVGLVIVGFLIIGLSRFNIPLFPQT